MDQSLSSNQGTLTAASETPSFPSLIERGIYCTRQGYYADAVTFFALAREQLTPDQIHFAAVLDALIQSHVRYMQAHDALLQAERNFAKADVERQTPLATLSELLSASEEAMNNEQFPRFNQEKALCMINHLVIVTHIRYYYLRDHIPMNVRLSLICTSPALAVLRFTGTVSRLFCALIARARQSCAI